MHADVRSLIAVRLFRRRLSRALQGHAAAFHNKLLCTPCACQGEGRLARGLNRTALTANAFPDTPLCSQAHLRISGGLYIGASPHTVWNPTHGTGM